MSEKRFDRIHYMDTSETETPTWSLINTGFNKLDDTLSPKIESSHYIADVNETDQHVGNKPSFTYDADYDSSDDVSTKMYLFGADQVLGAQVTIVTVDLWTLATGACVARKALYNVLPEVAGSGAPGGNLKMSGKLSQVGDITKGQFTIATKAFVAD